MIIARTKGDLQQSQGSQFAEAFSVTSNQPMKCLEPVDTGTVHVDPWDY